MKVIDILNKIANGEEVRELLNQEWYSVLRKETIRKVREILDIDNILNDKVEIIEEDKKIEKLDEYDYNSANEIIIRRKINEIIDYLNKENK